MMAEGCYVIRLSRRYVAGLAKRIEPNNPTTCIVAIVLSLIASTALANTSTSAIRLVDLLPDHYGTIINGLSKRMLGPKIKEILVPLPTLPPKPLLTFAAGVRPVANGGTMRFEIWLRPRSGAEIQLYQRELSEPGWWDEQVDLSPHPVAGATLAFRRIMVSGGVERAVNTGWGDPVIVSATAQPAPSAILISLDTLRADCVGALGSPSARTPALDTLIRDGLAYERAYSPSTWTYPSHQSLLFGLDTASDPYAARPLQAPAPSIGTAQPISAIVRSAGYLTAGFTGGGYVADKFGFNRGFDSYYGYQFGNAQPLPAGCDPKRFDGEEVFGRARRWLRERGRAPFFLFVHTYDVHDRCPFLNAAGTAMVFANESERQRILRYYDELISKTDGLVGALMAELASLGLDRTTLVVVTSDHGEGFGEHRVVGHGDWARPYEPIIHVPLILRYPGVIAAGQRVTTPVSLIDVAPSILSLLKVPNTAKTDGGILPGLPGGATVPARPLYAQSGEMLAVRDGRYKLITSRSGAFVDEVYDLETDPGEQHNIATTNSGVTTSLREHAKQFWQRAAPSTGTPPKMDHLDSDTKERLRALGYQ